MTDLNLQHRLDKLLADTALQIATIIEGSPRGKFCVTHGVSWILGGERDEAPYCWWAQVRDVVNGSHLRGDCRIQMVRLLIEEED